MASGGARCAPGDLPAPGLESDGLPPPTLPVHAAHQRRRTVRRAVPRAGRRQDWLACVGGQIFPRPSCGMGRLRGGGWTEHAAWEGALLAPRSRLASRGRRLSATDCRWCRSRQPRAEGASTHAARGHRLVRARAQVPSGLTGVETPGDPALHAAAVMRPLHAGSARRSCRLRGWMDPQQAGRRGRERPDHAWASSRCVALAPRDAGAAVPTRRAVASVSRASSWGRLSAQWRGGVSRGGRLGAAATGPGGGRDSCGAAMAWRRGRRSQPPSGLPAQATARCPCLSTSGGSTAIAGPGRRTPASMAATSENAPRWRGASRPTEWFATGQERRPPRPPDRLGPAGRRG